MTTDRNLIGADPWLDHVMRAGPHTWRCADPPTAPKMRGKEVEPWLSALLQAEHLNLLVGSGLTTAVASAAGVGALDMGRAQFDCELAGAIDKAAEESARRCGRGEANLEDQIRTANELAAGLRVLNAAKQDDDGELRKLEESLNKVLDGFFDKVLKTEKALNGALNRESDISRQARRLFGSFLLTFSSRAASRERLHIFTTNYDRLIEYGCDLLGLRVIDRFVGHLSPVFRSSRLGIDIHYNPPGIRGEPRYLEGVVRLTKLHGSIDWDCDNDRAGTSEIRKQSFPFGAEVDDFAFTSGASRELIVYPNSVKDVETSYYPYADLFRDFAAATCQPNSVVVTYGYGFGDDHINRVLRDMLTIPSAHLAIVSYDNTGRRIEKFCKDTGRDEQITLLIGNHFGSLPQLVEHYLPKPAIDRATLRMVDLINRRTPNSRESDSGDSGNPSGGRDR